MTTSGGVAVVEGGGVVDVRGPDRGVAAGKSAAQLPCLDQVDQFLAGGVPGGLPVGLLGVGVEVAAFGFGDHRAQGCGVDDAVAVEKARVVVQAEQGRQVDHDVKHRACTRTASVDTASVDRVPSRAVGGGSSVGGLVNVVFDGHRDARLAQARQDGPALGQGHQGVGAALLFGAGVCRMYRRGHRVQLRVDGGAVHSGQRGTQAGIASGEAVRGDGHLAVGLVAFGLSAIGFRIPPGDQRIDQGVEAAGRHRRILLNCYRQMCVDVLDRLR